VVLRRGDHRGLTTLPFTDIGHSSQIATELGDRRWRHLQARHHAEVRRQLKRHGGHEVDTAGDGFFAKFASPASGVRCAFAIVLAVRKLGLDVRAGLHVGEVELSGEKVGGIAVTTAQRVEAIAAPGQVLVTDTIAHLTAGSELLFTDLGSHELKGVPGRWEIFSLDAVDGESIGLSLDPQQAGEYRELAAPVEPRANMARQKAIVAGGVVLVVVAAALVFESRRSTLPPQAPPSAGPGGPAVVLDAQTGMPAFPVAIEGGWASQIVLTPSSVGPSTYAWIRSGGCAVANGCPGQLHKVNGDTGALVDDDPLDPLSIVEMDGEVWFLVTDHGLGVFVQGFDQTQNQPTRRIPIDRRMRVGRPAADVLRFAAGGGALWIGDNISSRVFRLDLSSGDVKPYSIDGAVDDIAFGEGFLWVMDSVAASVTRIDPDDGPPKTQSLSQLHTLSSITFGGGYVWATANSSDEVWRVSSDLHSTTPVPVGDAPADVIYADGAIWVANYGDKTVSQVDPRIASVTRSLPVAVHPQALAVADGKVWAVGDVYTSDNE
jgi:class 3 adenylate cyclase